MPAKQKLTVNHSRKPQITALAAAALFLSVAGGPGPVFGRGIALPDQDAFATARGNAFVATANDPAAVFYNPAGISQLNGINVSAGAYGIGYRDRYSGPGGSIDGKTVWTVIPQLFSTLSLPKYNLTLGFGTYSPYGLRMEWPDKSPFVADGEIGQITYMTAAPVIAWQIIPSLSVAAGPTLNFSEADLKEFPGFVNHFRGRATDAGYTAAVLFHPTDQHFFGLTYRSATEMNYNGHATVPPGPANTPVSADFHFPSTLAFGYSFRPNEKWNFEGDVDWSDWSTLKTVPLVPLSSAVPADSLFFNWSPSWMLALGLTRYLGHDWRISGGYLFTENSSPDANFSPLIPDSDRHVFSIGLGKKCGRFSWDVAYQLAWGPPRAVGSDAFAPANGTYEFLSHAITVNVGCHF